MDFDRHLAAARAKDGTLDTDEVARVELGEQVEVTLAENVATREQLDAAGLVLKVGKRGSTHQPLHHQPAADGDRLGAFAVTEQRPGRRCRMRRLEPARIRVDPGRAQPLELLPPVANYLRLVFLGHVPRKTKGRRQALEADLFALSRRKCDHVRTARLPMVAERLLDEASMSLSEWAGS